MYQDQDLIIIINTRTCVVHKYINSTTIVVVAAAAATSKGSIADEGLEDLRSILYQPLAAIAAIHNHKGLVHIIIIYINIYIDRCKDRSLTKDRFTILGSILRSAAAALIVETLSTAIRTHTAHQQLLL